MNVAIMHELRDMVALDGLFRSACHFVFTMYVCVCIVSQRGKRKVCAETSLAQKQVLASALLPNVVVTETFCLDSQDWLKEHCIEESWNIRGAFFGYF